MITSYKQTITEYISMQGHSNYDVQLIRMVILGYLEENGVSCICISANSSQKPL